MSDVRSTVEAVAEAAASSVPTPLTAAEAAMALRCHEKTIRRMIRRGDLQATFVAGRYLIDPEDLPTSAPARPDPPVRRPGASRGRASAAARRVLGEGS